MDPTTTKRFVPFPQTTFPAGALAEGVEWLPEASGQVPMSESSSLTEQALARINRAVSLLDERIELSAERLLMVLRPAEVAALDPDKAVVFTYGPETVLLERLDTVARRLEAASDALAALIGRVDL